MQNNNKIISWDIYEEKSKFAHSEKLLTIREEVEEYHDPQYNDAGELKIIINKVTKCSKVDPIEFTILKSRD
jgi:hypothetical protein